MAHLDDFIREHNITIRNVRLAERPDGNREWDRDARGAGAVRPASLAHREGVRHK